MPPLDQRTWKKVVFIFFDLLSFGSPQAIVINLSTVLLLLFMMPTETLLSGPTLSVYQNIVPLFVRECPDQGIFANCDLPSYGLTRGMSRLLHGDLTGAWAYNRGTPLLFIVMLFLIIINLRKIFLEYRRTGKWYQGYPLKR